MSLESGRDDSRADAEPDESHSDRSAGGGMFPSEVDPRRLAQDWITLWESEITALAADPELREAWQALASVWAGAMVAALRAMPRGSAPFGHERPSGGAGPPDAPRAAPAAAAPDARDAEIDRLARHIDALERRLADIERGSGRSGGRASPRRRSGRKPRSAD